VTLVADESVDQQIVARLRRENLSVYSVAEMHPGISDDGVLTLSNKSEALLFTADKDFGELVFRQGRATFRVVLIRLAGIDPEEKGKIVASAVRRHAQEAVGGFSVITRDAIRIRKGKK
jgi:predicted nuclease of predicted toxin-antitoxin system